MKTDMLIRLLEFFGFKLYMRFPTAEGENVILCDPDHKITIEHSIEREEVTPDFK